MLGSVVYANMNRAIFQIFGVAILLFEIPLVLIATLGLPRLVRTPQQVFEGELLFFGFVMGATFVAVGLICLHRWAAVTASILGAIWAIALSSALGQREWAAFFGGAPIVFGMLLPLYATIKCWSQLKPIGDFKLTSSFHALRSSSRYHLR